MTAYALELAGDRDGAERELLTMWRHFRELGEGRSKDGPGARPRASPGSTATRAAGRRPARCTPTVAVWRAVSAWRSNVGSRLRRGSRLPRRLDEALALAERARARVDTMSGLVNQQATSGEALAEVIDTAAERPEAEQARRRGDRALRAEGQRRFRGARAVERRPAESLELRVREGHEAEFVCSTPVRLVL